MQVRYLKKGIYFKTENMRKFRYVLQVLELNEWKMLVLVYKSGSCHEQLVLDKDLKVETRSLNQVFKQNKIVNL